jgi:branched-chain amino acid transport system permease protein
MSKAKYAEPLSIAVFAVVMLLLPLLLSAYWLHVAVLTVLFAFLCVAWNLVGGFLGALSFAHPLFFAAGGYATAYLSLSHGWNPWLTIPVGVAIAIVLAIVIEIVAHRFALPVLAYALTTLAFAHMGLFVVRSSEPLGGINGLSISPGDMSFLAFQFERKSTYFLVILAALVAAQLIVVWIGRIRFGLEMRAVRDNERAASAIGVRVLWTRVRAAALSAALTAFGGSFYAQFLLLVDDTFLRPQMFIQVILMTALGGMGTTWGPVLGAIILVSLAEFLRASVSTQYAALSMLIFGAVCIVLLRLRPHGLLVADRSARTIAPTVLWCRLVRRLSRQSLT